MTTLHEPSPEKLAHRKSAGEASSLSRTATCDNNDYETATSSSGPSSLAPESLSSASSFQSLASSVGSKSSSGICADSAPTSPDHNPVSPALDSTVILSCESTFDSSYVNVDNIDLDDIISACSKINLGKSIKEDPERSLDQTFESAADDTTLIIHDESVLQNFKTCTGATESFRPVSDEAVKSPGDVFKAPLPVNPQKSVVPYIAADSSLQQNENSRVEDCFKSALNSFSEPAEQRKSPTPCIEIDVPETVAQDKLINEVANQTFDLDEGAQIPIDEVEIIESIQEFNTSLLNTPDATFEEVDEFNSQTKKLELTQNIEPYEQDNKLPVILENSIPLNSTEIITNNLTFEPDVKEFTELSAEECDIKSFSTALNKTGVLTNDLTYEPEVKESTEVQAEESNNKSFSTALNKTEVLTNNLTCEPVVKESTELFTEESDIKSFSTALNKTGVITNDLTNEPAVKESTEVQAEESNNKSFSTALNKTEVLTNNLSSEHAVKETTEVHAEESNNKSFSTALNKTDVITNYSDSSIKLELDEKESSELLVEESNRSYSVALNQTEVISNNCEAKNDEDNLIEDKSWKEQINKSIIEEAKSPRENLLNKSNFLKSPIAADNNSSFTKVKQESPIKIKTENNHEAESTEKINNDLNEVDLPTEKEFISPIKKENFQSVTFNKNLNNLRNFEVTASTPLSRKEIVINPTPKNKSNLFPSESNSASQSPQPLSQKSNDQILLKSKTNNFDETVAANKIFEKSSFDGPASELITKDTFEATHLVHENSLNPLPEKEPEYEAFKPQQQSTSLPPPPDFNFDKLQEAALDVAKDIDASLDEDAEVGEHFISATTDLFEDPAAFDFLNQHGTQTGGRGDRYDSLFMKFDPLAQRLSMLPQKNSLPNTPAEVEEDDKQTKEFEPVNATPKKNPALAAIDRLLFESPSVENFNSKAPEEAKAKQKEETVKTPQSPLVSLVDEKMVKELELVRTSVLQLEEELEKQRQEHKRDLEKQKQEYKQQMEKMKESCEDKISHIQTKLAEEVKCKDQMTVVVEEYEKSISRLIADREKDKSSLEVEKARLQEELDMANQHLSNTEAAFSDVHSKYERLKKSVGAYRSNEEVLKESIAENQETIKTLENRYEQLKSHAMAQLEKANMELEAIRKQHDAETVKLKAMLRKAELKSKSLEETVEQKMKENKELTKIIDDMIARVN